MGTSITNDEGVKEISKKKGGQERLHITKSIERTWELHVLNVIEESVEEQIRREKKKHPGPPENDSCEKEKQKT